MKALFFSFFIFLCVHSFGQKVVFNDNILPLVKARISDMKWIEGNWFSKNGDTEIRETWVSNDPKSLMAIASVYSINGVQLYEILTITEENDMLFLRMRHFDSKLNAWEEKNQPKTMPLLKIKGNKYFFHGYTFEKIGKDKFKVWIQSDEKDNLITIAYNRI